MNSANHPMSYAEAIECVKHILGLHNVCMNRSVEAIEKHVAELEAENKKLKGEKA